MAGTRHVHQNEVRDGKMSDAKSKKCRHVAMRPPCYVPHSPFMQADKIKKPLLLVHGEEDNNTGTFPMQSERMYAALKGQGAPCRLVILPHESHGYRAYESIMHTLYEMDAWLVAHCTHQSAEEPVEAPALQAKL